MNGKRYFGAAALCVMALALAGCGQTAGSGTESGSSEVAASEASYRSVFTQEEMESGHASFAVAEHLYVDAEITPYEKYRDGLNSYYMEQVSEEGNAEDEDFPAQMSVFGQPREEFFQKLSSAVGFDITADQLEWFAPIEGQATVQAYNEGIPGGGEDTYMLSMMWLGMEAFGLDTPVYPEMWMYDMADDGFWLNNAHNDLNYSMQYAAPQGEVESLLSEGEILGWKDALEDLTGRTISDTWDGIQLTGERLEEISAAHPDMSAELDGWDYGTVDGYFFYYDMDGLPVEGLNLSYELKEGETATDAARACMTQDEDNNTLSALYQLGPLVVTDGERLLALEITSTRRAGDVYKEDQDIISPSDALATVAEYYNTQLLLDDVTVTDVRLIYAAYFTDPSEGTVDNAFLPFWKFTTYSADTGSSYEFVIDAVSGDVIVAGNYLENK